MKLLVCCLFVIANISDNGKASLESYKPTIGNMLFEDITRNSDKSCNRPCKFNVKPRRCHYDFTIRPSILQNGRAVIAINGISPGPPINVCMNDVIVVEVRNKIPDQDIAVHWHGMEQKGTPHMDGVPMVTQCPIPYGSTYKYAFIASSPGTFFYHADSVSHQSDGVYGSLIVNQPQPLDPHSTLYDYDRSDEQTLYLPTSLIINDDEILKMFVMQGFAYRLRLISAIAIECPVRFGIEFHDLVVIATDGKPVKPVAVRNVVLHPGERMDVVVRASQQTGGYWATASAGGACAGITANAMLVYSGFNYTSMLHQGQNVVEDFYEDTGSEIYGQMLESLNDVGQSPRLKKVYLGIDRKSNNYMEYDVDFRYISDAIPKKPFYPAFLGLRKSGVVQINGKSFLYPNSPMLLYPRDVKNDFMCTVGEEDANQEPQCVLLLEPNDESLEIALVNEGYGSSESYTFHMHGYNMQVVSTWQSPDGKPISKKEFQRLDKKGVIIRNTQNPPVKDTIVVPNKGYTIVRIRPERGGSWLLECRSCGVSSLPTAIIINVPQKIPISIVKSLSKCGSYRPPDVLLN
ncbi:hypothetical protein ACJJTC_006633 [Scirpophaga incertulas]